jgi:hypothetical protein
MTDGFACERFQITGTRHGGQLPAMLVTPPDPDPDLLPALVVAGDGMRPEERSDNRPTLEVDVFLTGQFGSPWGAAGRATSETHFAGYNRSDTAWRVQDVLTSAVALRSLTGAEQVDLFGHGAAGVWCLLARAVAPKLFRRAEVELGDFHWDAEADYLVRAAVPHLMRAGGLTAAVALAAPAPLTLHCKPARVPGWLGELYRALGAAEHLVVYDWKGRR